MILSLQLRFLLLFEETFTSLYFKSKISVIFTFFLDQSSPIIFSHRKKKKCSAELTLAPSSSLGNAQIFRNGPQSFPTLHQSGSSSPTSAGFPSPSAASSPPRVRRCTPPTSCPSESPSTISPSSTPTPSTSCSHSPSTIAHPKPTSTPPSPQNALTTKRCSFN